ncbi:unnamed protein product, partial [Rotaria magnacalcarata]
MNFFWLPDQQTPRTQLYLMIKAYFNVAFFVFQAPDIMFYVEYTGVGRTVVIVTLEFGQLSLAGRSIIS